MTLRKLLGAQAVATIPGRGCRFTAALDEGETAAAARPGDAPSGHDPPSIAVLPFLSIGGEPEQGWRSSCCAKLGLADRTRDLVERCLARAPAATVGKLAAKIPFKDAADREHLVECLRAAGFPR